MQVGSKFEAKFLTFSPPVKIRGGVSHDFKFNLGLNL